MVKKILSFIAVLFFYLVNASFVQASYFTQIYQDPKYNITDYKLDRDGNPRFMYYDSAVRQNYLVKLDWRSGQFSELPINIYLSFFDFDSKGNVWTASYDGANKKLRFIRIELATGAVSYYDHIFTGNNYSIWINGVVVDKNDNVWVVNNNPSPDNDLKRCFIGYNQTGGYLGFYKVLQEANISNPEFDLQGNIWVRASGNYLFKFDIATKIFSQKTYPASTSAWAFNYDFDSLGNVWMRLANYTQNTLTRYSLSTNQLNNYSVGFDLSDVLVDKDNQVWTTNYSGRSIPIFNLKGQLIETIYTGNNRPSKLAESIDGTIWVNENDLLTGKSHLKHFYIDGNPPVTTISIQGPEGNNNWYLGDVTVSLSAEDDSSGVKQILYRINNSDWLSYEGPVIINNEGVNDFDYYSVDVAGNVETEHDAEIKIDKTAPVINISSPTEDGRYVIGQELTAIWQAEDVVSGLLSALGTYDNGETILTTIAGKKIFSVTAIDMAGNQLIKTVTYGMYYRFNGFEPPLEKNRESFNLGREIPVKFQLFDYQNLPVTEAVATLFLRNEKGEEIEASSRGKSSKTNVCRYLPEEQGYIFNLDTKVLTKGAWIILLKLDDNSEYETKVILEDKKGR